jgi:hypothetical protein
MEFIGLFVTICGAASIAGWLMKWFEKMEG